jgi:hypothetical protein
MHSHAVNQADPGEMASSATVPAASIPPATIVPIVLRKIPGRPLNLDNCFIAIDNLPFGVRLTAGVSNDESTWLLTPRQLEEAALVVPHADVGPFPVALRVVMLDPDGYDFAATVARLDVSARVEPNSNGVCKPLELDFRRFCDGAKGWYQARFGGGDVPVLRLVDRQEQQSSLPESAGGGGIGTARLGVVEQVMLAARAEWEAEEEARFARAQARWQELEAGRRALQQAEADARLKRALAEAESRWRKEDAERFAAAERAWQAAEAERLSAHEMRWQAKVAQILSVLGAPAADDRSAPRDARAAGSIGGENVASGASPRRRRHGADDAQIPQWLGFAAILAAICLAAIVAT